MENYSKSRYAQRQDDTTADRIHTYLLMGEEEVFLSPHEEEVLARYEAISALSARGYSTEKLIQIHCNRWDVSRRTAYRDLRAAQEIFGDLEQVTRKAKRHAVEQIAKRGLRLASTNNDSRAHAQQVRNLILINRLDKEESNAIDPKQIQPPTLLLQVQLPAGKAATFDINKLSSIKDISYEEVLEGYAESQSGEGSMEQYLDELKQERE